VLNLFVGSNGQLGGLLFGLWVAGPLLAMGALESWLASRSSGWGVTGAARGAQVSAVAVLALVTVLSQVIVSTNRGSTAAILYVFAPIYGVVLAVVGAGVGWVFGRVTAGR
jgi:hypothetical protein